MQVNFDVTNEKTITTSDYVNNYIARMEVDSASVVR